MDECKCLTFIKMKSTSKKLGFLNLNSILFIILSITFLYQSLLHLPVAANDVLMPGDQINSHDSSSTLSSSNGKFTLGFFNIQDTSLTYLGIWYSNEEEGKKLWVANRDTPIIGNGVLTIDDSGSVKVINQSGTTFFRVSNDQVGSGNNTRAKLEDSGNFIVYDVASNRTIWRSFDHPTDTLIPGMKLGYNHTTRQQWTLTSWANDVAPTSGAFTMRLEQYQNSPQLLTYLREELYWASGPWNKATGTFEYAFAGFEFIYNLISDASGMYLIVIQVTLGAPILLLSPTGHFTSYAGEFMSTVDFCYGYQLNDDDIEDGCAVSSALPMPSCRAQHYTPEWETGDWIGNNYASNYDNSSISLGDCMKTCWNNCNCTGFTTLNSDGTGCIYWSGDLTTLVLYGNPPEREITTPQKYVLYSSEYKPRKKTWIWILVSLATVLVSVFACVCIMRIRRLIIKGIENKRRDDFLHQLTGSNSFNYGDELERGIKDAPDVKIFSFKAILAATNNFSNENKLGQGGYGPVYKGELSDGREIAVKRLSKTSGQGIMEFKSELVLISKLQHTNLVRLYGCCVHREEKMLIYEFMPNKSLDFFLFAKDGKEKIGWQIRFNIIEGIAQGLLYLHKYSRMKIVHRDLKVGNILLDENMNPKIADFGMARTFQQNVAEAITNRVVGTFGYMAPEYVMEGIFSIKSDVFSFGVLILEIVSGQRNSSFYNPDRPLNLAGYAWELWNGHASLELKDETLGESFDAKQLLRVIHVGLLCVQENADDRPTMSDVIYILNNENIDLPSPKEPAFFNGRQTTGFRLNEPRSTDDLLGRPIQVSENGLTVTTMEAR